MNKYLRFISEAFPASLSVRIKKYYSMLAHSLLLISDDWEFGTPISLDYPAALFYLPVISRNQIIYILAVSSQTDTIVHGVMFADKLNALDHEDTYQLISNQGNVFAVGSKGSALLYQSCYDSSALLVPDRHGWNLPSLNIYEPSNMMKGIVERAPAETIKSKILDVPYVANRGNEGYGVCWLASDLSIINYKQNKNYIADMNTHGIAHDNKDHDVNHCPGGVDNDSMKNYKAFGLDAVLYKTTIQGKIYRTLPLRVLMNEINSNRPVWTGFDCQDSGHDLVFCGYEYDTVNKIVNIKIVDSNSKSLLNVTVTIMDDIFPIILQMNYHGKLMRWSSSIYLLENTWTPWQYSEQRGDSEVFGINTSTQALYLFTLASNQRIHFQYKTRNRKWKDWHVVTGRTSAGPKFNLIHAAVMADDRVFIIGCGVDNKTYYTTQVQSSDPYAWNDFQSINTPFVMKDLQTVRNGNQIDVFAMDEQRYIYQAVYESSVLSDWCILPIYMMPVYVQNSQKECEYYAIDKESRLMMKAVNGQFVAISDQPFTNQICTQLLKEDKYYLCAAGKDKKVYDCIKAFGEVPSFNYRLTSQTTSLAADIYDDSHLLLIMTEGNYLYTKKISIDDTIRYSINQYDLGSAYKIRGISHPSEKIRDIHLVSEEEKIKIYRTYVSLYASPHCLTDSVRLFDKSSNVFNTDCSYVQFAFDKAGRLYQIECLCDKQEVLYGRD